MSHPNPSPPPPLFKQKSWSSDLYREEAWLRRKDNHHRLRLHRRSKSLITAEDIDELRGCIDLGFRFGSESDHRLSDTLPALSLYYATFSKLPPTPSSSSSTTASYSGDSQPSSPTAAAATSSLFGSGE